MPKRKANEVGGAEGQSTFTFRLVTGEPFDVQGVKVLVEQLVYKSIEYTNKKLLEGPPAPVAQREDGHESHEKVKVGRRRYSRDEKRIMIGIYDKYPVKEAAMEIINKLEGFPRVTPGMILSWKRPQKVSAKRVGRQVDQKFEDEVLAEIQKQSQQHSSSNAGNSGSGAVAAVLGLSYAHVRECAMLVWERLYPDENGQLVQKWKAHRVTKSLKFSHKWVVGLLKRVQAGRDGGLTLADDGVYGHGMGGEGMGGYMLQADDDSSEGSEDSDVSELEG